MPFAVHISDGFLPLHWVLGGYGLMAALLFVACRKLSDREIPRIALLTAAIFISSSIHIPTPPTRVHLLLNSLAGVLVGYRAPLAITIGLALQWMLIQHGGVQSLGVNCCVQAVPAFICWGLFRAGHGAKLLLRPYIRSSLVGVVLLLWFVVTGFVVRLAWLQLRGAAATVVAAEVIEGGADDFAQTLFEGVQLFASPAFWGVVLACTGAGIWLERRCENAPEFPLGLAIGSLGVALTAGLNTCVLLLAGETAWRTPILLQAVLHLPVALVEGVIVGFLVGFLTKVRPDMLASASAYSSGGNTSSNGTSH